MAVINLEFDSEKNTISVKARAKDGGPSENFRITEDTFSNLFAGRYSTGYLSVSQDGPVYIEEREGSRVVIVQRGFRLSQPVTWAGRQYNLPSPWCFFGFRLLPANNGFTRSREFIVISDGPCRGAVSPVYSAEFMGNVYRNSFAQISTTTTNICWGNTAVAPGGVVSMASLTNIANDFFAQPFTGHLESSIARWEEFGRTNNIVTPRWGTLSEMIEQLWK